MTGDQNRTWGRETRSWLVWALFALTVAVEGVLFLSDLGWLGLDRARGTAYEYAGFWPGLLSDWHPNYAAQPYLMFITYGFLHGGVLHLVVNMATLVSLGGAVRNLAGNSGLAMVYAVSLLGGGLAYGLLSFGALTPMVGASGAIFGLVGALLCWTAQDRRQARLSLFPVARMVLVLVVINVVLWWVLDGQLAWQTHLGGFLCGWLAAASLDQRSDAS